MAFGYPGFFIRRVPHVLSVNLDRDGLEKWTGVPLPPPSGKRAEECVAAELLDILGVDAGAWLKGAIKHHVSRGNLRIACSAENSHGLYPPLASDPAKDFHLLASNSREGRTSGESVRQAAQVFGVLHKNAWTLRTLLIDGEYGYGLYHWGSLFNSSCAPNAIALFEGSKMVVRGLRPIRKNEEVTVAYNSLAPLHPLHGRTQANFVCCCIRCKQDRAVQISVPHDAQEKYFGALASAVTHTNFWSIPELARNIEAYQLLGESGVQVLMTSAGSQFGRWDIAFLAFEAYLRRVSSRGPHVPHLLHEIDSVSYTNVLLGLLNAAWRCGVQVLKDFTFDWRRDFPLAATLVKTAQPSADLHLLHEIMQAVTDGRRDLVDTVRERDAELALMNLAGAYGRLVTSAAESVPGRDADNILLKPRIAQAFAMAHAEVLRNGMSSVEGTKAFRRFLDQLKNLLGLSECGALNAIRGDALLASDLRQMLDIHEMNTAFGTPNN